jgi:hypothetical protein
MAADCALVIGVSKYGTLGDELPGGVADALRMTDWLMRPDGGRVRPLNIRLLLSRRVQDTAPAPANVAESDASYSTLVEVVDELVMHKSGNRLFVYFSGHGITDLFGHPVLLLQGYSEDKPHHSVTLDSLVTRLQAARFPEQHVWIDACRDVPAPSATVSWSRHPKGNEGVKPAPEQYGIHATSPGLTAQQLTMFQRETGAFTTALLDALAGRGAAANLDEALLKGEDRMRYVVTYASAFDAVRDCVESRKLPAAEGLIQSPRRSLESGHNPTLVAFDVDPDSAGDRARFARKVNVAIEPATAPVKRITFEGTLDSEMVPAGPTPWDVELFHSTYFVRAHAPGFVRATPAWPMLILTAPETDPATGQALPQPPAAVTVRLRPEPTKPKSTSSLSNVGLDAIGAVDALDGGLHADALDGVADLASVEPASPSRITVTAGSADPQASIEIAGADGIRAMASGRLTVDLAPGRYQVRVLDDQGERSRQELVLDGSSTAVNVEVAAPPSSPTLVPLIHHRSGPAFQVSERLGWLASIDELTVLALAACSGLPGHGADNLARLGCHRAVEEALPTGVAVVIRGLASVDGALGAPTAGGQTDIIDGMWWSWRVASGRHQLRLTWGPDAPRALELPLAVLPDHVTLVVLDAVAARPELVQLWLPREPRHDLPAAPGDWRGAILAQRALSRGDLGWARAKLEEPFVDPARTLLRFALAAATATSEEIADAALATATMLPSLPDGPCGRAVAARAAGAPFDLDLASADAHGIPVTRIATEDMLAMHQDTPPPALVDAHRRIVPGWAWTSFAGP